MNADPTAITYIDQKELMNYVKKYPTLFQALFPDISTPQSNTNTTTNSNTNNMGTKRKRRANNNSKQNNNNNNNNNNRAEMRALDFDTYQGDITLMELLQVIYI